MTFCALDENCAVWDSRNRIAGVCYSVSICEGCRVRSMSELRMLRLDYVDLSQILGRRDRRSDVSIFRPKPESSMPLDLQVLTLRHDIANAVCLAEAGVRAVHHPETLHFGAGVREGAALDRAVRYLEERVELLAGLAGVSGWWDPSGDFSVDLSGPQILLLLSALHRRARIVLGLSSRVIGLPGWCPNCGVANLRRHEADTERIWCATCKEVMDRHAYMRAVTLQIDP